MCSVSILLILLLYLGNLTVSEIDERSIDFHQGYAFSWYSFRKKMSQSSSLDSSDCDVLMILILYQCQFIIHHRIEIDK